MCCKALNRKWSIRKCRPSDATNLHKNIIISDLIVQLTNIQVSGNPLKLVVLNPTSFAVIIEDKVLHISVIRNNSFKLELNEQKSYHGKVAQVSKLDQDDSFISVDCNDLVRYHLTNIFLSFD